MKLINVLFFTSALAILSIMGWKPVHHAGDSVQPKAECPAVIMAWPENVSVENFDLHWEEVGGAAEYLVEVFVNGTVYFEEVTPGIHVFVELSIPLQAGDILDYQVTTLCESGSGSAFIGRFSIIATVDVVMGLNLPQQPQGQLDCGECPFIVKDLMPVNGLFSFYHCSCVNTHGWVSFCKANDFALQLNSCEPHGQPEEPGLQKVFFPNPFNNVVKATVNVTQPSQVSLSILDVNGEEMAVLIDREYIEPQNIEVSFDGSSLKKGVYYYLLKIGDQIQTGQLLKH
ncbi:MAG: T9SS type A sorting domain-containing protein [Bacteroidota bacterium]